VHFVVSVIKRDALVLVRGLNVVSWLITDSCCMFAFSILLQSHVESVVEPKVPYFMVLSFLLCISSANSPSVCPVI